MNAQEAAAILSSVAWPITVMGILLLLLEPLRSFLEHLGRSLQLRSLTLKLWGVEAELSVGQAQGVLDKISGAVVATLEDLTPGERELFQKIVSWDGKRTVKDLLPHFAREEENEEHKQLQNLRDVGLIRPKEGGRWQPYKSPIVTRFGRLAQQLYVLIQIQSEQKSPPVFEEDSPVQSS